MLRLIAALLAAGCCVLPAHAHDYTLGPIVIGHPWSRPTAPGMPMGVAYFTLTNNGNQPDALIGARTPRAARVEIHGTRIEDGVARMRPLEEIPLAPGKTVKVEPGGIHLMLVELDDALVSGTRVPLTLEFRVAGQVTVELSVEMRDVSGLLRSRPSEELGTVTVMAHRPSSLPIQIPTTIESITGETLARTVNATDAEDALKYFPSLNVRKRYIGDFDHAVLASRASGTQNSARSLVYADGILLSNLLGNGATFTPRWGLVTPEEIERVEVLYGPFSAAYPGNSVGAVVDYVTRMPESLELRGSLSAFTEDFDVYGTDESYGGWQASTSYGDRRGATAWWVNFNRLDSESHPIAFANRPVADGVPGDGGIAVTGAVPSTNPRGQPWWLLGATNAIATVQDHAKLKLTHGFTPALHLAYTLGLWRNRATRESRTWLRDAQGTPVYSGPVNVDGRVFELRASDFSASAADLLHLMHGLSLRRRDLGNWDLELAASRYDYQRDRTRSATTALPAALTGGAGRIADQSGTGWTTALLRASWQPERIAGAHLVELGVSDDRYRLRTEVRGAADWRAGPPMAREAAFRGETRLSSAFAQDSWRFADAWRATVGLRFEHWRADDGAISNATSTLPFAARSESYWSPKFALSREIGTGGTIKASVGRAVRFPTVAELYQGSISADAIVNNDPDLAPERSWTSELSLVNEFGHGSTRCTVFFEETRDALYSQVNVAAGGTVSTIQNVDRVRTRGAELTGEWRAHETLKISGSVTWAHSRVLENDAFPASEGAAQPRVPEWRANAVATWEKDDFGATVGARYSGRQYNQLDNSDHHGAAYTGTSRFLVFDARVHFTRGRLRAALGVDNLGNERYWAFHPYARRTYSAELSATM